MIVAARKRLIFVFFFGKRGLCMSACVQTILFVFKAACALYVFFCLRTCLRDSVCKKEALYVCGAVCRVFELAIKFCQGR